MTEAPEFVLFPVGRVSAFGIRREVDLMHFRGLYHTMLWSTANLAPLFATHLDTCSPCAEYKTKKVPKAKICAGKIKFSMRECCLDTNKGDKTKHFWPE